MNAIFASSRGLGLDDLLPSGTTISVISGGKINQLRKLAEDSIPPSQGLSGRRLHCYFLCGILDITSIQKNSREHYRECIYTENPDTTIDKIQNDLLECQKSLLERGALPIFCTIPNVNIEI